VQNQSQLVMYDTKGAGRPILSNEETEGWLQPNQPLKADDHALLLHLQDSGTSAGRFRHITRYRAARFCKRNSARKEKRERDGETEKERERVRGGGGEEGRGQRENHLGLRDDRFPKAG